MPGPQRGDGKTWTKVTSVDERLPAEHTERIVRASDAPLCKLLRTLTAEELNAIDREIVNQHDTGTNVLKWGTEEQVKAVFTLIQDFLTTENQTERRGKAKTIADKLDDLDMPE